MKSHYELQAELNDANERIAKLEGVLIEARAELVRLNKIIDPNFNPPTTLEAPK